MFGIKFGRKIEKFYFSKEITDYLSNAVFYEKKIRTDRFVYSIFSSSSKITTSLLLEKYGKSYNILLKYRKATHKKIQQKKKGVFICIF